MTDQQSLQTLAADAFNIVFKEGDTLNSVCARLAQYDTERFEAVALRFYSGDETFITVFAHDKFHGKNKESDNTALPVRKFKITCSVESFLSEIQQLNFTVSVPEYSLDKMEVTNK
jgi:hypothetical protein